MLGVGEMGIEFCDTMPSEMQYFQQPSLQPLRLEGKCLPSSLIPRAGQLISFYPAGNEVSPQLISSMQQATMQQATINGAAVTQGHALLVGEARKISAHEAACSAAGISFVPLVMESIGGMSASTVNTLTCIGRLLGQRLGIPPSDSIRHLLQRCSISVWRGNAALWLRRSPTFAPSIDGVH